jgi:hypothetical protein
MGSFSLSPWRLGGLAAFLLLAPAVARAQGNDRSAPTGGRTELMGNTGIALGEDGSAPFMNPATIVRIKDSALAFSVNFFDVDVTNFSNWHQPGNVDATKFGTVALSGTSITSAGFNALPSTLCLFFTLAGATGPSATAPSETSIIARAGRQKLAFCVGTLEAQSANLPAVSFLGKTSAGMTAQAQSVAESWSRVHAGPTYSAAITDNLALGLSLHGVYTQDAFTLDGSSITSEAGGGAVQSSLGVGGSGHSFDFTAILGATYRFDSVTVGLSSQLVPLQVFGSYSGVLHDSYAAVTTNDSTLTAGSGNFSAPPPIRIGIGIGAKRPRFTVEADASFDFPWDSAFSTTLTGNTATLTATGSTTNALSATYTIPSHAVFNAAVGGEYFIAPDFSVLGGFSTNFSSVTGLSPQTTLGNLTPSRTNWLNASIGLGSYGAAGSILIGTVLGFGWGQAMALNPYVLPNSFSVVDTQSYSALFVLAGAVNFKSVGRAVQEVESVVKTGNPDTEVKTPGLPLIGPDAPASPPGPPKPAKEPGQ